MKLVFLISAVLGLTATSAMAECAYHSAQTKVQTYQQEAATTSAPPASEQEQALLSQQPSNQPAATN